MLLNIVMTTGILCDVISTSFWRSASFAHANELQGNYINFIKFVFSEDSDKFLTMLFKGDLLFGVTYLQEWSRFSCLRLSEHNFYAKQERLGELQT